MKAAGHATGKAAALLGLGTNAVVAVEVDADGAMAPGALRSAVLAALDAGRTPLAVIATAGTTVTCAFDPLDEVADVEAMTIVLDELMSSDRFLCFGPDSLAEARNRGYRLRSV